MTGYEKTLSAVSTVLFAVFLMSLPMFIPEQPERENHEIRSSESLAQRYGEADTRAPFAYIGGYEPNKGD